jgi:hypothetical protein
MKTDSTDPKKDVANELAELFDSDRGVRQFRLLQVAGLLVPATRKPAATPVPPPQISPHAGPRPISFWKPQEVDGELAFVSAPPSLLGEDHALRQVLKPKTNPAVSRVCLLGESVAAGYLYAPHLTPAGVLEHQLNALAGDGSFEVIDLARANESLASLVSTLEAALQLKPDLFVVFMGNNWNLLESRLISPYIPSVQARQQYALALRRAGLQGPIEAARQNLRREATRAFARLTEIAAAAEVPVVVVIPEVNQADWDNRQPVAWLPGDGTARWYDAYERAMGALAAGDCAGAEAAAEEMIALDGGTCPTPHRLLAKARLGRGDAAGAHRAAVAEIDGTHYPNLCFLSSPQANSLARELVRLGAERHGHAVIDLRQVFAEHTGCPLTGRLLFLDYCHMTSEGMRVAMAAVTAQVAEALGAGQHDWRALLDRLPAPAVPPAAEAITRLGAAIHNAHRMAAVGEKGAILDHWCREALAASPGTPGIIEAMLDLLEARTAPCPAVLTAAQQRALQTPYRLQMQHGWRYDYLDASMIEALLTLLESQGHPVRERFTAALLEHHGIRPEGTDLAHPSFYLWEPIARFYPDFLNLQDLSGQATFRAPWPESSFCLVCDGESDVQLTATVRLPAVPGTPADRAERKGRVTVEVNGTKVGTLPAAGRWKRKEIRLPRTRLKRGINRLTLRWPKPPAAGDEALAAAIERLENGQEADLHPVFGEVFSLIAK